MISTDGEWNDVLKRIYGIFVSDFKKDKPELNGLQIWWDRRILKNDIYEEGFWHLITRIDNKIKDRLFDPERAKRLPWCNPIIVNFQDEMVKFWDYKESDGRLRTYLWLEDFDYAVVLEKRAQRFGNVYFLITAFYVDGSSKRKNLRKKYEKRKM